MKRVPGFKTIPSHPRYEVSRTGRVREIGEVRELARYQDPVGRLLCTIRHEGRAFNLSIARAVGDAWCPGFHPSKRPVHLDGDKLNCRPSNLDWVTVSELAIRSRRKRKVVV